MSKRRRVPGARRLTAEQRNKLAQRARAEIPKTLQGKLDKARADKDKRLGELARTFLEQINALYEEWAEARRKAWRDYDAQRAAITRNHKDEKQAA